MKIKVLIAVLFTIFEFVAFSNAALSQTTKAEVAQLPGAFQDRSFSLPPIVYKWQDQSSSLPGIVSDRTAVIVGVTVVAAAAVVVGVLVFGHKKHHKTALNTGLNPTFNINYYTSELRTGLTPNFDVNLVFSGNIKGAGIRYSF